MKPTRSDHLSEAELAKLGLSRETDLVLTREGVFLNAGVPVSHPAIAAAFARWIERSEAGRYVLRNDLHYVYLCCEGAPLHAERVEADASGGATLVLRGGTREALQGHTLRQSLSGELYADARDGSWPVRFLPRAVLDLEPFLALEGDEVQLRLGGRSWPVPSVPDPLAPRGAEA